MKVLVQLKSQELPNTHTGEITVGMDAYNRFYIVTERERKDDCIHVTKTRYPVEELLMIVEKEVEK